MNSKKWWASKVIWTGVVTVCIAAYNTASAQFGFPAIPEMVYVLLGAFGIYARTSTKTVIK